MIQRWPSGKWQKKRPDHSKRGAAGHIRDVQVIGRNRNCDIGCRSATPSGKASAGAASIWALLGSVVITPLPSNWDSE